jgi:hypothetical protein
MFHKPPGQKFVSITVHIPLGPLYSTQLTDPTYRQGSNPTDLKSIMSLYLATFVM